MSVWGRMVANAGRTIRNIGIVVVLLISLVVNVASFTVNSVSMGISTLIEAVTGVDTLVSTARKATQSATKLEAELAEKTAALETERVAKAEIEAELAASRKLANWGKETVGALELKLEKTEAARVAAELEATELRVAGRVTYQGVEMAVPEAVTKAASTIKARTVKLAFADLSATGAQALPWIGAAVVVAATGYDLKMSCDNMRDMREIEVAVNPTAVDDPDVERVCGLKVPTEEEVWAEIKASPGAVWEAAVKAIDGLPSLPDPNSWEWPSLPEIGRPDVPDVPDINWKFWE